MVRVEGEAKEEILVHLDLANEAAARIVQDGGVCELLGHVLMVAEVSGAHDA